MGAGDTFARKLNAVGRGIVNAQTKALNDAGKVAKAVTTEEIRKDTGDGRLSGVGKNGAKVGVRYDVQGGKLVVKMTGGSAAILERGRRNPVPVKPKKRGKKQAIVTPWGPKASAKGSTAPGKHTFDHAYQKAKPRMATVMAKPLIDAARAGMRS